MLNREITRETTTNYCKMKMKRDQTNDKSFCRKLMCDGWSVITNKSQKKRKNCRQQAFHHIIVIINNIVITKISVVSNTRYCTISMNTCTKEYTQNQ